MPHNEEVFQRLFGISVVPSSLPPVLFDKNIEPGREILALHANEQGEVVARPMLWTLIPNFASAFSPDPDRPWYNIRKESLYGKYKEGLLRTQRCAIPAAAFMEKSKNGEWYEFSPREDDVFLLGALYDIWQEDHYSCTIITVRANQLITPVHRRMPYILPRDFAAAWLTSPFPKLDPLLRVVQPFPPREMVRRQEGAEGEASQQAELF